MLKITLKIVSGVATVLGVFVFFTGITSFSELMSFFDRSKKIQQDLLVPTDHSAKKWWINAITLSNQEKMKLNDFQFEKINRMSFVAGKDLYTIEILEGFVIDFRPGKAYKLVTVVQDQSPKKNRTDYFHVKYFDLTTNQEIKEEFQSESLVEGATGKSYVGYVPILRGNFKIVAVSSVKETMEPVGSLDAILFPLQRYTGGYRESSITLVLGEPLEKMGLYSAEKREEELIFDRLDIVPTHLDGENLRKVIRKTFQEIEKLNEAVELINPVKALEWNYGFRYTLPSGLTKTIGFHFIRMG